MRRLIGLLTGIAVLGLAACGQSTPNSANATDPAIDSAPVASPTVAADPELEMLKTTTPVDACALLTQEELALVYPELKFELQQELKPRMSGYVWDSRCTYWAGLGAQEFAKDVPTHTVEIFVATYISDVRAQENLATRHESAMAATDFQEQLTLGTNAHATSSTGVAWLFFVKGQSQMQISVSDLDTPNEAKVAKAIALAQSL